MKKIKEVKPKEIKVIIDEYAFEEVDFDGAAFVEDSEIILKEPNGEVLLHEIIHCLEGDPETHNVIVNIFNSFRDTPIEELMKDDEYMEIWEEILEDYPKEDWISEIYAYAIEFTFLDWCDDNVKEAISHLEDIIFDEAGVFLALTFETHNINDINIK
jgi:hypothetical protein